MKTLTILLFLIPLKIAFSQQVSYPLHSGDRWEYANYTGPLNSARIDKDTLMPNGQHYAIVVYNNSTQIIYERQQGNKVYRYSPQNINENLWYDFDLSPGDTVNSIPHGSDTTDIILGDFRQDTIFGISRRTWYFGIDYFRHYIDDEQSIEITDSLGLTDITEAFGYSTLRGAIINGRKYGTITDIGNFPVSLPHAFQLNQNYPNPFNPSTTISYQLPMQNYVTLKVFDMLGREVATLVNGVEEPGYKSVNFNASNLGSGVYYYRMQAGNYIETKKLMLLR